MEPILINSAKTAASKMTNSNAYPAFPEKLDTRTFKHNLEFGFIALIMACTYVETCLNTMCRALFNSTSEDLRTGNAKDKIEKILSPSSIRIKELKASKTWSDYMICLDLRNDFVHYKSNFSYDPNSVYGRGSIRKGKGGKVDIVKFFTRNNMEEHIDNLSRLIQELAEIKDLKINESISPVIPDVSDKAHDYICKTTSNS